MLNPYFTLLFLGFWHTLFVSVLHFKPEDIGKNIVHFIHAIIYVVYYNTELDKYYLVHLSAGFYIYDLLYIINQIVKKNVFSTLSPYIIHHLIAIYGLYFSLVNLLNIASDIVFMMFYILEISNFMLYISYHIHKSYPEYNNIKNASELIQFIWYTYFRVLYFTRFILIHINYIYTHSITVHFVLITLYSMGLIWSYRLFTKNLKTLCIKTDIFKNKDI